MSGWQRWLKSTFLTDHLFIFSCFNRVPFNFHLNKYLSIVDLNMSSLAMWIIQVWSHIYSIVYVIYSINSIYSGCVYFSFYLQKLHCLSGLWWQQRHCLQEKLQSTICHISTVPDSQTNQKKNTDSTRRIDLCACRLKLFSVELVSF